MKKSQNKNSYFCILCDENGKFKGKLEELEVKEVREVIASLEVKKSPYMLAIPTYRKLNNTKN